MVRVHVCAGACANGCGCLWKPEETLSVVPQEPPVLFSRQSLIRLELTMGARLGPASPRNPPGSAFPTLGLWTHATISSVFTMWVLGLGTQDLMLAHQGLHQPSNLPILAFVFNFTVVSTPLGLICSLSSSSLKWVVASLISFRLLPESSKARKFLSKHSFSCLVIIQFKTLSSFHCDFSSGSFVIWNVLLNFQTFDNVDDLIITGF